MRWNFLTQIARFSGLAIGLHLPVEKPQLCL